ncbi:MAG: exodeoxyribonuclease III [Methanomassiliicoccales archaeon]|nr:MAG: exodeoxyribonuclease III [Methanomassiliicoccales archaeon]
MRLLSWNVNGIRAASKKGLLEWVKKEKADIICLQETKARPEQLTKELLSPEGYHSFFSSAEKKGYSGTVTYSKEKPSKVLYGMGEPKLDSEGRMVITEFEDFVLFNVYFPNGKRNRERLGYKLDFYDAFLEIAESYKKKKKGVVACGDFNTAHSEIDLARPKENENVSGFLPIERKWIDTFISHGYTDTFRRFNKKPGQYSWWDYKTRARERNIGWRIDYFYVSNDLLPNLKEAFIQQKVMGSDHCPVGIILEL